MLITLIASYTILLRLVKQGKYIFIFQAKLEGTVYLTESRFLNVLKN